MRYLILSDIHSNLEGLTAVLAAAEGRYDTVCCLGDIVGYGADPNAVTEWVRANCEAVIRGNHDKTCCGLEEPTLFNPAAKAAVEWTYDALSEENRAYLRALIQGPLALDDFTMVHGSLLDEDEYLIDVNEATPQLKAANGRLVFFGHTHVQGGFFANPPKTPDGDQARFPVDELAIEQGVSYLVNPGSVGQPRDLIWQAAYALYDSDRRVLAYDRCEYDVETAQAKIRAAGLPEPLAARLAFGR